LIIYFSVLSSATEEEREKEKQARELIREIKRDEKWREGELKRAKESKMNSNTQKNVPQDKKGKNKRILNEGDLVEVSVKTLPNVITPIVHTTHTTHTTHTPGLLGPKKRNDVSSVIVCESKDDDETNIDSNKCNNVDGLKDCNVVKGDGKMRSSNHDGDKNDIDSNFKGDSDSKSNYISCSSSSSSSSSGSSTISSTDEVQPYTTLHFYRNIAICSDLESERIATKCNSCFQYLSGLNRVGFCLMTPLPAEVLYVPSAMTLRERENVECTVVSLGTRTVSRADLFQMQRFHKGILCWESEEDYTKGMDSSHCHFISSIPTHRSGRLINAGACMSTEQWCRSGGGAWYCLVPLPDTMAPVPLLSTRATGDVAPHITPYTVPHVKPNLSGTAPPLNNNSSSSSSSGSGSSDFSGSGSNNQDKDNSDPTVESNTSTNTSTSTSTSTNTSNISSSSNIGYGHSRTSTVYDDTTFTDPILWSKFLKKSADEAQILIHNLRIQERISRSSSDAPSGFGDVFRQCTREEVAGMCDMIISKGKGGVFLSASSGDLGARMNDIMKYVKIADAPTYRGYKRYVRPSIESCTCCSNISTEEGEIAECTKLRKKKGDIGVTFKDHMCTKMHDHIYSIEGLARDPTHRMLKMVPVTNLLTLAPLLGSVKGPLPDAPPPSRRPYKPLTACWMCDSCVTPQNVGIYTGTTASNTTNSTTHSRYDGRGIEIAIGSTSRTCMEISESIHRCKTDEINKIQVRAKEESLKPRKVHTHADSIMMAPEFCRVLGEGKWYFCGLVAPSVVWRVSSLALSVEARDSVVCLMDAFSAANPQILNPMRCVGDLGIDATGEYTMHMLSCYVMSCHVTTPFLKHLHPLSFLLFVSFLFFFITLFSFYSLFFFFPHLFFILFLILHW
jgi:hypothetical protein